VEEAPSEVDGGSVRWRRIADDGAVADGDVGLRTVSDAGAHDGAVRSLADRHRRRQQRR
jgi:hypothetical protein